MDSFIVRIIPICLAAAGGAVVVISFLALMGKANILMGFESRHFAKKYLSKLTIIEGIFGLILSSLLFFCASTILFENPEKTQLATILLGGVTFIYMVFYAFLWVKWAKKSSR
jgi:ABC-type Fe3+-siderophore transport system permease subunit